MKIWINKAQVEDLIDTYSDAIVFNMLNEKGNLGTNFQDIWRRFDKENIEDIYEDLLVIAISVFAVDRKVPRKRLPDKYSNYYSYNDNWTRNLDVCIPVLKINKWNENKDKLEEFLNFLTGDEWNILFRKTKYRYRCGEFSKRRYENRNQMVKNKEFDCVSLFSGGLDSFCGALHLLERNKKVFFVTCMEHKLLKKRVDLIYKRVNDNYPQINKGIYVFSANPGKPENVSEDIIDKFYEDTSRSRSFLFMAVAVAIASIIRPKEGVYIPENGFIGINLPLTKSRLGSCSTRTTHVWALKQLNLLLNSLDIDIPITNFYKYKTKGEIVEEFKDNDIFKKCVAMTLSCSHPTHGRMAHARPPINCGYCYPCMIRRASLHKIGIDDTEYIEVYDSNYKLTTEMIERYGDPYTGRAKDLVALLEALHVYEKNENGDYYKKELVKSGNLTMEEVNEFDRVCKVSLKELENMMLEVSQKNDPKLVKYIGIKKDV
ncbi:MULTISPECIES: Qat anti-phage system QueC-like protein QatC [unclassified Lacrimispora]|uniref:Qat anti-phage system QueC-like protein QatC n=1 Tax=unclassified Lacrimispora TaxID=2719232 RepID=UPI00376F8D27